MGTLFYTGGCNRATALRMYQGARPFGHSTGVGWIWGVFGVIWGVFGVIVGVFLEIRECFWTICGVFLDDYYSKLAKIDFLPPPLGGWIPSGDSGRHPTAALSPHSFPYYNTIMRRINTGGVEVLQKLGEQWSLIFQTSNTHYSSIKTGF